MAEDDLFGFLLIHPSAVSRQAAIIKDLQQHDCELVYQEWVSLDHERAKKFLELYAKSTEESSLEQKEEQQQDKIQQLCENSCLVVILKKKQLSGTLKGLFGGHTQQDTESSSFSTKYGLPCDLFYYCTDKSNARECIEFFFPNRKC
jgi:nucleoside diphosphate kinase